MLEKVQKKNPEFRANNQCARYMFNVAVGIVWQLSIMAAPLTLVGKNWTTFSVLIGLFVLSSCILKRNWFTRPEAD